VWTFRRSVSLFALVLAESCSADASAPQAQAADVPRRPVVLELFTSEGCSSCPPADALLRRLANERTIAGAEVIPLELHVDYWNSLGWADPFSSPVYSARQRAYSEAMGRRGSYTPQLVVDGTAELLGSHESGARHAIEAASSAPKAKVEIERDGAKFVISVAQQPSAAGAEVLVGVTESNLTTAVPRGENGGQTLAHGPVVRDLRHAGTVGANGTFRAPFEASLAGVRADQARIFAFLQRPSDLKIVGAASIAVKP
jgi:hypothetical protein